MLAIEVEYLLGRAVATDTTARDVTEWPPHPTRLFSALVDALGDVGGDDIEARAECEAALRWLETLAPPVISASIGRDVSLRAPVKYWVPINDEVAERVRAAPLTEQRKRQERFFPSAVPADPFVVFAWPNVEVTEVRRRGLDALTRRVAYLGHSSSLVRVARREHPPPPTLAPDPSGTMRLRVPGPGRFERLEAVFALRRKNTLVQPPRGAEVLYASVESPFARGPHGAAKILALESGSFGLQHAGSLLARVRAAVLSMLGDGAPEVLSGHREGGGPSHRAHLAFVPLANVDHRFADGALKGVALVLPRNISVPERRALEQAASRLRTIQLGARGTVGVRLVGPDEGRKSLDFGRYAVRATTWASVTPIALGKHPKPKKGLSEEDIVLDELAQLGLPEPVTLALDDVSFVRGAPRAREVSRGATHSLSGRVLRHAKVRFAQPVEGPLLVGAGRHAGFGFLLPMDIR